MMGTSEEQKHMDWFWKQDTPAIIGELATKKNCHVTLVIHPRKGRDDQFDFLRSQGVPGGGLHSDNTGQDTDESFERKRKEISADKSEAWDLPLDFDENSELPTEERQEDRGPSYESAVRTYK